MASLVLPSNFAYVSFAASSTAILTFWQSIVVSKARKAAGIKYPTMMVDEERANKDPKAKKFNCAQRAHGNTLEALPTFLVCLLLSGLSHPLTAATFGAIWVIGRILYTLGYITGKPEMRYKSGGAIHNIGYLGIVFTALYVSGNQIYHLLI